MDRSFFESTLQYNWDLPVGVDRSLSPEKVREYLSRLSPGDQVFISDLLRATTYVKFQEFKSALLESFQGFRQAIGEKPFYLLLPAGKIGSEHWLVALLWPELRKLNLLEIIDENTSLPLEGVNNILIVDDAIYSGNNTLAKIDMFLNKYRPVSTLNTVGSAGKHFKFHILIPYISTFGTQSILDFCRELPTECTIYGIYYLPALPSIIRIPFNHDQLYQGFGIELIDLPAIYFDHKVAGPMSTFSTIYLEGKYPGGEYGSLLKVLPSREKIHQLEDLFSSEH